MKAQILRAFGFLTTLTLLNACATSVHTSMYPNHFISPESSGGFLDGSASVGITTGKELVIIPSATSSNAKVDPSFDENLSASVDLWLGIIRGFDVELLQQDLMYGAKIQIIGQSAKEAKSGNVSIALFARYNSVDENETIDNYTLFQGTTGTVYSKSHRRTYDGGVSFGLRLDDDFLLTAAPFYTKRTFDGTLNTTTAIPFSGVFAQYGLDLGLEFRSGFGVIRADVALTESEALGLHSFNPYVGIDFGIRW